MVQEGFEERNKVSELVNSVVLRVIWKLEKLQDRIMSELHCRDCASETHNESKIFRAVLLMRRELSHLLKRFKKTRVTRFPQDHYCGEQISLVAYDFLRKIESRTLAYDHIRENFENLFAIQDFFEHCPVPHTSSVSSPENEYQSSMILFAVCTKYAMPGISSKNRSLWYSDPRN